MAGQRRMVREGGRWEVESRIGVGRAIHVTGWVDSLPACQGAGGRGGGRVAVSVSFSSTDAGIRGSGMALMEAVRRLSEQMFRLNSEIACIEGFREKRSVQY